MHIYIYIHSFTQAYVKSEKQIITSFTISQVETERDEQNIIKLTQLIQLMSWDECHAVKTIVDAVML